MTKKAPRRGAFAATKKTKVFFCPWSRLASRKTGPKRGEAEEVEKNLNMEFSNAAENSNFFTALLKTC